MKESQEGSQGQARARPAPGCGFVILWIVLNFVGVIVGLLLGGIAAAILSLFFRAILPVSFTSAIFPVIIGTALVTSGAIIGSAQWLVLRGQIAVTAKWIGATALGWTGWGMVMLLGFFLPGFASRGGVGTFQVLLVGLTVACAGAILGSTQWFVLREHVSRAGSWILISAVAWVLGSLGAIASIFVGSRLLGLDEPLSPTQFEIPYGVVIFSELLFLFSLALAVALVPAVTGLGLTRLLRLPMPLPQNR